MNKEKQLDSRQMTENFIFIERIVKQRDLLLATSIGRPVACRNCDREMESSGAAFFHRYPIDALVELCTIRMRKQCSFVANTRNLGGKMVFKMQTLKQNC